jgi:phosphate/sulfate permease
MSESRSSGGIGFGGVLLIVFITLKLCEVIDWSWWWVLSPIWIGFAVAILLLSLLFVVHNVSDWRERKRYLRRNRLEPF